MSPTRSLDQTSLRELNATILEPVVTSTTLEETVARLGAAIRVGLLAPGNRLPPERELAMLLRIGRSTLRQAIEVLTETGHLIRVIGRRGGTFVTSDPPLVAERVMTSEWHEKLESRMGVELGVAALATERITIEDALELHALIDHMQLLPTREYRDFRRLDAQFHLKIAQIARSQALFQALVELQDCMSWLLTKLPRTDEAIANAMSRSNAQHRRIVSALERHAKTRSLRETCDHIESTGLVLAGFLAGGDGHRPADEESRGRR